MDMMTRTPALVASMKPCKVSGLAVVCPEIRDTRPLRKANTQTLSTPRHKSDTMSRTCTVNDGNFFKNPAADDRGCEATRGDTGSLTEQMPENAKQSGAAIPPKSPGTTRIIAQRQVAPAWAPRI
jgi:hypothetical protein